MKAHEKKKAWRSNCNRHVRDGMMNDAAGKWIKQAGTSGHHMRFGVRDRPHAGKR